MSNERRAVVTLAVGKVSMWRVTHPRMKAYATKVGADFVMIQAGLPNAHITYSKLKLKDVLTSYDRVLYLDGDIALHPHCPDLFEMVPAGEIGAALEKHADRSIELSRAGDAYGVTIDPRASSEHYFNAGLMLVSRAHRSLFDYRGELIDVRFWEQDLLNVQAIRHQFPIMDLGFKFNFFGSLALRDDPPLEAKDAYVFHATEALGIHRHAHLREVISLWDRELASAPAQRLGAAVRWWIWSSWRRFGNGPRLAIDWSRTALPKSIEGL